VSETRNWRLSSRASMVKAKLAPNAWADLTRLPTLNALLTPSTPIAKYPRMSGTLHRSARWGKVTHMRHSESALHPETALQ
jgi:hypothetical protein